MRRLIYVSALSREQNRSCVSDIVQQSIRNNKANDITGMLLFINGSFLQVLEGAPDALDFTYAKILEDPRHTDEVKILDTEVSVRQFPGWSMGHAELSRKQLDHFIGENDFFTSGRCLTELNSGAVRRVLTEFREGRWRRQIR